MESPQRPSMSDAQKLPADRIGGNASVIASIVATWVEIDVALTPIIGHQGVTALYKRSVHLTARTHPWLAAVLDGSGNSNGETGASSASSASLDVGANMDALRSVFLHQDASAASAAGEMLLRTFFELLTSLIGASLTERLLHSVWANFLSDPSKQDFSP